MLAQIPRPELLVAEATTTPVEATARIAPARTRGRVFEEVDVLDVSIHKP